MDKRRLSKAESVFCLSLATVILFGGCAKEGGGKVGKEPIKYIARVEGNAQTLKAWIGNGAKADVLVHIDSSDEMRIFPQSLKESMKNAAGHIRSGNANVVDMLASFITDGGHVNLGYEGGLYHRVFWVIPTGVAPGETPLENFKKVMMDKRGYTEESLGDLEIEGRYITGKLAGVPITITRLEDLDIGEKKAILHVDLSYFSSRKSVDPDYQPGTESVIEMLRSLRESDFYASFVTIDFSSTAKNTPIDIRYMGNIIYQALVEPSRLEEPLPRKWGMMMEAEDSLINGNYEEAKKIYDKLTGLYPDDPGLAFSAAVTCAFMDRGVESREELKRAYSLDPMYIRGFFQLAQVLAVNGQVETGETILQTEELARAVSEKELSYHKGVFYLNAGRFYDSINHLRRAIRRGQKSFPLRSLLYTAFMHTENEEGMIRSLESMLEINERKVIREMPWVYRRLAELYLKGSREEEALELYERYLRVVPPDSITMELENKVRSLRNK
jgi:hypothetical protein